ncbi:3-deoxy-manno-octulosonate cytidylyltransferase [Xanthobacter wiegelii]|uniref:3-deoxy-manno-octulosonate cytidylyltransferase n=1 Tax=Xanthobacter wiegelii TaxID=3119913 RepID=UPI00372C0D22
MSDAIVLIPARMGSTRLPGKPLADLGGRPMIVEVAMRAAAAGVGPVVIATDAAEIARVVEAAGFDAVMTAKHHQSGSDRIFEALGTWQAASGIDRIVNVQGDLPTIDPGAIRTAVRLLDDPEVDIATLCALITDEHDLTSPHVVKVVGSPRGPDRLRALYFTRATAPWGDGPHYHHIGLYAYRRAALARFVASPPSALEKREKLEQLRALELGMRIDVEIVADVPLGVDVFEDLAKAAAVLRKTSVC